MKTTFNWGDDVIDSRNIIDRFNELDDEYNSLIESLEESENDLKEYLKTADEELTEECKGFEDTCVKFREAIEAAKESLAEFNSSYDKDELDTLVQVIKEGEDSPDWQYGEALIHESFFETYIEDLINDCYELPKEMNSGQWPWRHLTFDISSAAEEAKMDYNEIEVDGNTYYLRA